MKRFLFSIMAMSLAATTYAQNLTLPPSGDNQKSYVKQRIGSLVQVSVYYSSPDVTSPSGESREGKIWGQLVPYGLTDLGFGLRTPAPWRAGANENTVIKFSHDVEIEGQPLAAGKYGLFLIAEDTVAWTWIFSKSTQAWGSYFYKADEEVLRVQVEPRDSPFHEWLSYDFTDRQPSSCELTLHWENKGIPMKISVPNMDQLYVDNMRKELESSTGFTHTNWAAAANYCVQKNINLEEALTWADNAINMPFFGNKNFATLQSKANVLIALKKVDGQDEAIKAAIDHPTASAGSIHQWGRALISQGQKELAMKVFQESYNKFKGKWPTNVSMMRGLSALGRYDEAVVYAAKAHDNAPDKLNKDYLVGAIEKLKEGKDIN